MTLQMFRSKFPATDVNNALFEPGNIYYTTGQVNLLHQADSGSCRLATARCVI